MMSQAGERRREIHKQLSFALYGAANRMIRKHKPFLQPLGLTFPQYLVMVDLLDQAPQTVGDLGTSVGLDTGTITPLLKRLEKAGFVTRQRDTRDERRVLVDLTPDGLALRDALWAVPEQIQSVCNITKSRADDIRQALNELADSDNE